MPPWREYTHVQDAINQAHHHRNNFRSALKVQATILHTILKDIMAGCFLKTHRKQPTCLLGTIFQQHLF